MHGFPRHLSNVAPTIFSPDPHPTMEDSRLSIIASVTGILTFFAAIMGFVYVRYEVLQNGTTEMNSILETAMSTIVDNEVWNEVMRDMVQNSGRFERRDTLQRELFKIQFQILTEYHSADLFTPAVAMLWATAMTRTIVSTFWRDIDPEAWSKFRQKLQCREYPLLDNSGNDSGFGNVLEMRISKRPVGLVWRLLVNFGASPALLRWYMIREKVLEKVRRRETIQSQLLLYQISTANS